MKCTGKEHTIYMIDTSMKFYTGLTSERRLPDRIQEHIDRRKSNYMRRFHYNRPKKPVFVERLKVHDMELAEKRARKIKNISKPAKRELVKSDKNDLIDCKIRFGKVKYVILRGDKEGEIIVILPRGKIEKRRVGDS